MAQAEDSVAANFQIPDGDAPLQDDVGDDGFATILENMYNEDFLNVNVNVFTQDDMETFRLGFVTIGAPSPNWFTSLRLAVDLFGPDTQESLRRQEWRARRRLRLQDWPPKRVGPYVHARQDEVIGVTLPLWTTFTNDADRGEVWYHLHALVQRMTTNDDNSEFQQVVWQEMLNELDNRRANAPVNVWWAAFGTQHPNNNNNNNNNNNDDSDNNSDDEN